MLKKIVYDRITSSEFEGVTYDEFAMLINSIASNNGSAVVFSFFPFQFAVFKQSVSRREVLLRTSLFFDILKEKLLNYGGFL